jgi:ABC-type glycerol-3-phosphate transport system substrate-binding protein
MRAKRTVDSAVGPTRRHLLKAGLALPLGGALLAACTPGPSKDAKPAGGGAGTASFEGVTLQIGTNPGDQQALTEFAAGWAAKTGGKAVVNVVPYAERAIKFAGFIASQDGSMDLLYGDPAFVAKFGERLFMDLTHKLDTTGLLSSVVASVTRQGKLLSAPISSDMYFLIYNKEMFAAAGADPSKPPQTFDELYGLADKLHSGSRYGCVLPWLAGYAHTYWTAMYNGSGQKMFNDDATQVLFNNEDGLKVFQTIKAGLDNKFYDPNVLSDPGADQDTAILFAQGKGASQIGSSQYWSMAVTGNKTSLKPENVGAAQLPAITPGKFGTTNAFEGVGVNKFTKDPEACLSFLQYMVSKEAQKNMMVAGKSGLPAVRADVLTDPDVAKVFPIGGLLAEMGTRPSSAWPTPYDTLPVFDQAVNNIAKNGASAQQALDSTVKGCTDLIAKYLSS